jgi:hypothetical protein
MWMVCTGCAQPLTGNGDQHLIHRKVQCCPQLLSVLTILVPYHVSSCFNPSRLNIFPWQAVCKPMRDIYVELVGRNPAMNLDMEIKRCSDCHCTMHKPRHWNGLSLAMMS